MTLGVLDWGIGGLFCLQAAIEREPSLNAVYLSDSGNVPYGRQDRGALATSVARALDHLAELGATHILVACHSASTALPDVTPPVPTSGVIRAGAVPWTDGRVAVFGGRRTIRSGRWRRALEDRGFTNVVGRVAQPLSAHVEAGRLDHPDTHRDLDRILAPVRDADVAVLACTHYAALAPLFRDRLPRAQVMDPALAAVEALPLRPGRGDVRLVTTGDPVASARSAALATRREWRFEPK